MKNDFNFKSSIFMMLVVIVFMPRIVVGQTKKIDSLTFELNHVVDDSLKRAILYELIEVADEYNMVDKMLAYVNQMEELAERVNASDWKVGVRYLKARIYFGRFYKMDTALIFIREAFAILDTSKQTKKRQVSYQSFWNITGLIHKNRHQFDSAIYYYSKIIESAGNAYGSLYFAHYNISNLNTTLGNDDGALEHAYKSLEIARAHNADFVPNSMALVAEKYFKQGSYRKAIEIIDGVVELWSAEYQRYEKSIVGLNETKISCLLGLNRLEDARELTLKTIAYNEKAYGNDNFKLVDSYILLGRVDAKLNYFDEAFFYLNKALFISKNFPRDRFLRDAYYSLGMVEFIRRNYKGALSYYDSAMNHTQYSKISLSGVHEARADVLAAMNNFELAITDFEKSIILKDGVTGFNTENIVNTWKNVRKLGKLAKSYEGLYRQNENLQDLELALTYYTWSDVLINRIRNIYKWKEDEIDFASLFTNIYEGGIGAALRLHDLTKEEAYLESAFQFAEKSKASTLLNAVLRHKPKFSSLPDSITKKEEDLRSTIQFYQTRLTGKLKNTQMHEDYQYTLTSLTTEYESLLSILATEYPEYYQLKYDANYLSSSAISSQLKNNQTILEYGFYNDSLVAFIISVDDFYLKKLSIPDNLDSLIYYFSNSLKDQYSQAYLTYGLKLYQLLYKPLKDLIKTEELIIVPDGNIWYVSFDLLPQSEEIDYLLVEKAISYANSANHLMQQKKKEERGKNRCLAFSYSETTNGIKGDVVKLNALRNIQEDIPGTLAEVKSISNILPGDYLYGREANEKNFKEMAGAYSILHLALHGETNDSIPNHSRLAFAQSELDTLEDDYLHAFELYDMKLDADLIVLSACNTGVGKLKGGEGIMSLGRAFQYAGTESVVISNWEVVDGTAPQLMESFYLNLNTGMSKSEALRQAKLDYLENASVLRSHPYFWGAFTIIGNNDPINLKTQSWKIITIALIVLSFLGLVILRYRKREGISS